MRRGLALGQRLSKAADCRVPKSISVLGQALKPHCGYAGEGQVWDRGSRPLQHGMRHGFLGLPRCQGPPQERTGRSAAIGAGCCSLTHPPSQALPPQQAQSTRMASAQTGSLTGIAVSRGQQTHLRRPKLQSRPQRTLPELKAGLQAAAQSRKQETALQQAEVEGKGRQATRGLLRP